MAAWPVHVLGLHGAPGDRCDGAGRDHLQLEAGGGRRSGRASTSKNGRPSGASRTLNQQQQHEEKSSREIKKERR